MSNFTSLDADEAAALKLKAKANNPQLMESALLDCYGRFITLLPEELLEDHVHLYFQIQEAYWWYEDVWREKNVLELPKLTLKDFGHLISIDCPVLRGYVSPSKNGIFLQNWANYCRTIPLRGAILLNKNLSKCLMVQSWKGGSWMFPRGKIDEDEEDAMCASREVWEEIGVNISPYIDDRLFIEAVIDEQHLKLFIIPGVDESSTFRPKKRKEIRDIKWIDVKSLPGYNDIDPRSETSTFPPLKIVPCFPPQQTSKFWQVSPFSLCIKHWIVLLGNCSLKKITLKSSQPSTRDSTAPFRYSLSPKTSDQLLKQCQFAFFNNVNSNTAPNTALLTTPISTQNVVKNVSNKLSQTFIDGTVLDHKKNKTPGIPKITSNPPGDTRCSKTQFSEKLGATITSLTSCTKVQGEPLLPRTDNPITPIPPDNNSNEHRPPRRRRLSFPNPLSGNSFSAFGWGSKGKTNHQRNSDTTPDTNYRQIKPISVPSTKKNNHANKPPEDKQVLVLNNKKSSFNRKDQHNETTFGSSNGHGWNVEEMFKMNEEKFGVLSTFDMENYTVPIPSHYDLSNRLPRRKGYEGYHSRPRVSENTEFSELPSSPSKINSGNNPDLMPDDKGKFLLALLKNEHENSSSNYNSHPEKEQILNKHRIEKTKSSSYPPMKQVEIDSVAHFQDKQHITKLEKSHIHPLYSIRSAPPTNNSKEVLMSCTTPDYPRVLPKQVLNTREFLKTTHLSHNDATSLNHSSISDPPTAASTATSATFREGNDSSHKSEVISTQEMNNQPSIEAQWHYIEKGMQEMLKLKLGL